MEFAMLAPILIAGIMSIIELSYKTILQSELDNKMYLVTANLSINDFDATDPVEYMRDEFCPNIGTNFMNCSKVEIGVRNITGSVRLHTYRNISVIGEWTLGCTNDTLIVEMNYPADNIIHPIIIGDVIERNGERYYRSRGIIRREPLLSGGSTC